MYVKVCQIDKAHTNQVIHFYAALFLLFHILKRIKNTKANKSKQTNNACKVDFGMTGLIDLFFKLFLFMSSNYQKMNDESANKNRHCELSDSLVTSFMRQCSQLLICITIVYLFTQSVVYEQRKTLK